MSNSFTYEQESMAKGAAALQETHERVVGYIKRLESEMQAMYAGWTGPAQQKFMALHQRWVAEEQRLLSALRDMHEALASTRGTINRSEGQVAESFGSLDIS